MIFELELLLMRSKEEKMKAGTFLIVQFTFFRRAGAHRRYVNGSSEDFG